MLKGDKIPRREKLLEFNMKDISIGKCKYIETDTGSFEVCRENDKIEIYRLDIRL